MKENGFTLKKARSRRYRTQTITDADYADDIAFLANTLTQAESLLYNLEQAAGGIGLHIYIQRERQRQRVRETERASNIRQCDNNCTIYS